MTTLWREVDPASRYVAYLAQPLASGGSRLRRVGRRIGPGRAAGHRGAVGVRVAVPAMVHKSPLCCSQRGARNFWGAVRAGKVRTPVRALGSNVHALTRRHAPPIQPAQVRFALARPQATPVLSFSKIGCRGFESCRPCPDRVAASANVSRRHSFAHPGIVVATRVVAAVLVYQAVLFTLTVVLFAYGVALVPAFGQAAYALIALAVAEGVALGSVLLMWRIFDRRPLRQLGLETRVAKQQWLRGAGVGVLMMAFIVLGWYTLLDGAAWFVNPDPVRATVALTAGLVGFAVQGPSEELLFRGYILENLRSQWGARWAVVISALGFGVFHSANPEFGPLPFLNLVLFGVATALYKLRFDDGQLWGVCAIHTMWNWLQQVVFGLPNSGIAAVPENALFSVTPNPALPDPIWGGGFGPEGTLAASLVLLALIGAALRRPQPAPQKAQELAASSDRAG
jgi:uncharacterized protein